MKNIVLMLYLFLKWTTVATFVTYLYVSSVVMDFSYLASQHQLSSSLFDSDSSSSSSVLLNPEQHKENELVELTWGFSSKLEDKEESLCQFESEVGDGFCDDNINTEICLYDGGDCCRPGAELKPNNHWFCSDCKCHSGAANENVHLKPGFCEVCMFPFVDLNSHVGFPQAIAETSYDCVQIPYQNGKYYCPTAVYKDTKYPYGVPYSWSCPDMEEHELHPSCFISPDNVWICNATIKPDNATSSSVRSDCLFRDCLPQFAIDNNRTLEHLSYKFQFFRSDQEEYPWLQLHFNANVTVLRVAITNRFDIGGSRFRNTTVSVGNVPGKVGELSQNPVCATYKGPSARSSSIVLTCAEPLTGIYLVVQQITTNMKVSLTINEVFVCGN